MMAAVPGSVSILLILFSIVYGSKNVSFFFNKENHSRLIFYPASLRELGRVEKTS